MMTIVECFALLELFFLRKVRRSRVRWRRILLCAVESLLLQLFSSAKLRLAVVVVDCDLRHGVVHQRLEDAMGLCDGWEEGLVVTAFRELATRLLAISVLMSDSSPWSDEEDILSFNYSCECCV